MKILNPGPEDYHIHSNYLLRRLEFRRRDCKICGDIGMTKIAICDHSAALLKADGLLKKTYRSPCKRWQNVHNNVEVIFGVEADLLNESGMSAWRLTASKATSSSCPIMKKFSKADLKKIADGFINAIKDTPIK